MTRVRIYPYNQGSRSARALADALNGRVLKTDGTSVYRQRQGDLVINWGASGAVPFTTLNPPAMVARAANKLAAFQVMQAAGVNVPAFWTRSGDIPQAAFDTGGVVCRTILNGHSGRGIVLADTEADLVPAPLYTQYVKKQDEYRIHIVNGEVIAVQRKARRMDVENPNWRIRNHGNGFAFVRDGVNPPADVIEQARASIISLGLDFGGIDVIWNEHQQRAFVLECNTACGLEGQTVLDYANAFRRYL